MDTDFLQRLLELLERLQSAVLKTDTEEKDILRKQIERHIDPFAQFVDTLRQCQSMYGCYNNQTAKVIGWAAEALSDHSGPYPALWYDGFAHEKFLIELRRWIKKASGEAGDRKKEFSFNEGQALYDGKDLGLPSGETIEILQKLVGSLGKVVKHKMLDSESTDSNASAILKGRIHTVKKALKSDRIPYKVEAKRGVGYVLQKTKTT